MTFIKPEKKTCDKGSGSSMQQTHITRLTQKRAIKASFIMTNPAEKESTNRQKKRGFSAQELEKMEYYLAPEHWNQDEVFRSIDDQIIDATELFYKAEQFLNANTQKKSLGGRVFDAISSFGNHMDKEDDTNDN